MSYVQNNLNPGERILYATHLHWIVLIRSIFVDTIFSVAGLALIVLGFRRQAYGARRGSGGGHRRDSC